jgi:hypothetical protein
LALAAFVFLASPPALANVAKALLNVDLANPGSTVSSITFYVMSPGIGTKVQNGSPISVISPPGTSNRFTAANGIQAGLATTFIGKDVVKVTLTPLKVWGPMDNIQFIMTVANTNNIRIVTTAGFGAQPPSWLNNNNPMTAITPRPRLPGFQVTTKDADFMLFNDDPDNFGVQNLSFMPNITESAFDMLDLDSLLAMTSGPSFALNSMTSQDFPNEPDPDLGNVFAAEEQIFDTSGSATPLLVGAFAEGVETTPEPSTLALFGIAVSALVFSRRHRAMSG